ncbi:cytochrome c biogenesis protein ResB [Jatrophihabitans endophyticus]|uniref:cytochrome c biogenesis protein ResB n=1 Tax=Jatrophihabitans endophyticus TaxID=1206085 RepID=UPI0019F9D9F6|nr:cytochrome c biogenesis protein ResB [Jatrophihabitans endophyticus]MBE7187691.1 cytochrome c biogenesis protein ResB [Jatrophihabitans endophyticus]
MKAALALWRRLTSMRTALILLFLLAVAAVPGSLLPQKPLNPSNVTAYIKTHGAWGRLLDRLDMFDVFGSPWFAAIYLLLFVSLVGCLIPRIRVHARASVRKPLPAPRVLGRLPESAVFSTSAAPADYVAAARTTLGRRWRVAERTEDSGALTISAEKGYSRETGNLVFHVALLVALVLVGIGQLYKYEGTTIVRQGQSFCNVVTRYDNWVPGRFASEGKIHPAPFCIDKVNKFTATYSDGEPRAFAAKVTYQDNGTKTSSPTHRTTIKVNHPLRLEGDRVYLTGHGFAPTVRIRLPDGTTQTETANFLPSDATTLYSQGVFTAPATNANRSVGISGFFAPSPYTNANGVIASSSPAVKNPVLGLQVYVGNLNRDGQARSVYSLDTSKLGKPIGLATLREGQTKTLADGVRVTFVKWTPYVDLQVSHDPTQDYLLVAALAMVLGLAGSLGVRRRRLWLRVSPQDGGPTLVRVGGLARSDSGNFTTEFAGLVERLSAAASGPGQPHDDPPDGSDRSSHNADAVSAGKD